jgi:hypothetical protein
MTEVPRFYYESVKELEGRGVEFLTLAPGDEIPSIVRVVLTTEEEKEGIDFKEITSSVAGALRILNGAPSIFESLILGIDPGQTPGFAVLGDGRVVHAERLGSPEDILETSKSVLDSYSGKSVTFRVGRGGEVYKERILKILQENFDMPIEVVDESRTTPMDSGTTSERDIIAAINIALKQGRTLRQKIEVSPGDGEIKNIQSISRKLSGNITISRELAERVAKGEISIEEAIELQREK